MITCEFQVSGMSQLAIGDRLYPAVHRSSIHHLSSNLRLETYPPPSNKLVGDLRPNQIADFASCDPNGVPES